MLVIFTALILCGYNVHRALGFGSPAEQASLAAEKLPSSGGSSLDQFGDLVLTNADLPTLKSVEKQTRIEDLQVGERIRSDAPTEEFDLQFGTDIIRADWRKLTLVAPKRDGSSAEVVLLRPLQWLTEQQAEVGGTVFISVPECGIDGHANVLAIEQCPPIEPAGDLGGRVITGTFRHQVSASIALCIAGQAEPILCTSNHPFWSEDRHDFVRAASLQPNETLRTTTGTTTVTSLSHIPGSTPVYNLEIHGTHVYHVGSSGVLVHNGNDLCPDAEALFNPLLRTKTLVTVLEPGQTIYGFVTRKGEVLAQAVVKGKAGHEQMANQLAVSGLLAKIKSGEIIPFTVSKHSQTGQMAIFGSGYFGNWNMSQWQKELIGKLFK